MSTVDSYADLRASGLPVLSTREAAARLGVEQRAAGQRLRRMEESGLVRRVRRGLWALDSEIDPQVLAPYLTAPFPAYVSLWSALYRHEMIQQIPRQTSISSLGRSRRIETSIGVFEIHHLDAKLFDGFAGDPTVGYLATPEKALFDMVYVRAASGARVYFPELTLPMHFKRPALKRWAARIESPRLRTIVMRQIRQTLKERQ